MALVILMPHASEQGHFAFVQAELRVVGVAAVSVGTLLLIATFALARAQFIFDPSTQVITWKTWLMTGKNSGELMFSDVRDVFLQSLGNPSGSAAFRVALCTTQGKIPVGSRYTNGSEALSAADRIRSLLGMPPETRIDQLVKETSEPRAFL
jgi:hypothetical protein